MKTHISILQLVVLMCISLQVFIWLDAPGHVTMGSNLNRSTPFPVLQLSSSTKTGRNDTNETLLYQVYVQRQLTISSTIQTANGSEYSSWTQKLSYSNQGNYTESGNVQVNVQHTEGYDMSSSGYSKHFNYPLYARSVYSVDADNFSIAAVVERGKDVYTLGPAVFPTGLETFVGTESDKNERPWVRGASMSTTQNGSATYMANSTSRTSFSFGMTEQDMVFAGVTAEISGTVEQFPVPISSTELFHRYVKAINSTVVHDEESSVMGGSTAHDYHNVVDAQSADIFGVPVVNDMLGHRPHGARKVQNNTG